MYRVYSDEGHGGRDPGAVGNGYKEKNLVLPLSTSYVQALNEQNIITKRSRTTDVFIPLNIRSRQSNSFKADIFTSHHLNSFGNSASGVEVLYRSVEGKKHAELVLDELMKTGLFEKNRGTKHRTNLAVLNGTNAPAIIIEYGFISHPRESKIIANNLDKLGRAAARGTMRYLGINPKEEISVADIERVIKSYLDTQANAPMQAWSKNAIDFVTKKGIMQGYDDGSFKPNKPVTRAELAQVIYNVMNK